MEGLERRAQGMGDGPVQLDPVGPNEEAFQIDTSSSWLYQRDSKLRFPSARAATLHKGHLWNTAVSIAENYANERNQTAEPQLIYDIFLEALDEEDRQYTEKIVKELRE